MANIIQVQDTRRIFIETLIELAEKDTSIVLITCDVGFNYLEEFKKRFPERFFNFGVTEQSSTIIAAGLALAGFKPYIYSMINFVVFRPYEMARNAIVMHKANVKVIGVKGSEKYKFLGFSHNEAYENEDLQLLSPLMDCYVCNTSNTKEFIEKSYNNNLPAYIRL